MVKYCCVDGCKRRSDLESGLSFHRLPQPPAIRDKWLSVVPIRGKISDNILVCSLHFKPDSFTLKLKPDAVPTIFPKGAVVQTKFVVTKSESKDVSENHVNTDQSNTQSTLDPSDGTLQVTTLSHDSYIKHFPDITSSRNIEETDIVACSVCLKGFTSEIALQNHVRSEHFETYTRCDPKEWSLPLATEDEEVLCGVCGKGFSTEISLLNHVRLEHLQADATEDLQADDGHESTAHENVIETIDESDRVEDVKIMQQRQQKLLSRMEPARITKVVSRDVRYIVMENDEAKNIQKNENTTTQEAVQILLNLDASRNENYDDNQEETMENNMSRAKKILTKEGPFECFEESEGTQDGLCRRIFGSCCEYSAHFRDEHARRRKCLYCQVCEQPLVDGLDPSEVDRMFTCAVCDEKFQSRREMKDHIDKHHAKLRPFRCTICPKRFTQQGGLQQHLRLHSGIRPFHCTYCPKKFTQKSNLIQHLRIHTKEKPYRCIVCHKSFIQPTHLKQHMRTHTNFSPFQCGICQKSFKQGSQLTSHLRVHGINNMTDDQKRKHVKLLADSGEASEMIEIEIGESEAELIQQVEGDVVIESIEEESIQVEQVNDDCYVIEEEPWTGKENS